MTVQELIQWLASFEDQDAEVEVVQHSLGHCYWARLTLSGGLIIRDSRII